MALCPPEGPTLDPTIRPAVSWVEMPRHSLELEGRALLLS